MLSEEVYITSRLRIKALCKRFGGKLNEVFIPRLVFGKEYKVVIDEFIFLVELDFLNGAERLEKIAPVKSIVHL